MDDKKDCLPRCANCGLEVAWEPVAVDGKAYCCAGCAVGGPCYCSYDLPVATALALPAPAAGRGEPSACRGDR